MLILLYLYNTRASSTPFGEGGRDAKVVLAEGGGADKIFTSNNNIMVERFGSGGTGDTRSGGFPDSDF